MHDCLRRLSWLPRLVALSAMLAISGCGPAEDVPPFPRAPEKSFDLREVLIGVSPDGQWLVQSGDKVVILTNRETGQTHELTGAMSYPDETAFTPDGAYLVTGHTPHWNLQSELNVWDMVSRTRTAQAVFENAILSLAVRGDGKQVVVSGQKQIEVLDLPGLTNRRTVATATAAAPHPHDDLVQGVAFLPSGEIAAAISTRGVEVYRAAAGDTWELARNVSFAKTLGPTALSADGKRWAVARSDAGFGETDVVVLDTSSLAIVSTIKAFGTPALSPDGELLAMDAGGADEAATLYRTSDGKNLGFVSDNRSFETTYNSAPLNRDELHGGKIAFTKDDRELIVGATIRPPFSLQPLPTMENPNPGPRRHVVLIYKRQ